ncbi:MAG: hypothetical protein H0V66_12715 [Bdellovibrionales bacterium]|nr:hypothetical protein [Bdellovibrionales bacterium]
MLTKPVCKICALLSLTLIIGCGKNIKDKEAVETNNQIPVETLSSELTLQVDGAVSLVKIFKMPRNAWFQLPDKLIVKSGNAAGMRIKIFYNLLNHSDYEFQCTYLATSDGQSLTFEKCESSYGNTIISNAKELIRRDFPMDKGSQVKLQLSKSSGSEVKIDSSYFVNWK